MSSVTCRLTYTAVLCRCRVAGVKVEPQGRIERLGANHLDPQRHRRQRAVRQVRDRPNAGARETLVMAPCCMSAAEQAGGSVCLVGNRGTTIPVAHCGNPAQRQHAVYRAQAVVARSEAGIVKQYLSEGAPRPARQAAEPTFWDAQNG